jgi:soluble lytic murein transglycosylase
MGTWIGDCGDPRGPNADALSFIECHPLTETRNYMMRVTENMRVYRARLNGGTAPLTATADITQGTPAPFGAFDASDVGDGSLPDGPISYADYQKAQARDAAAAAALAAAPKAEPKVEHESKRKIAEKKKKAERKKAESKKKTAHAKKTAERRKKRR